MTKNTKIILKKHIYYNSDEVVSILSQLENGFPKLVKKIDSSTKEDNDSKKHNIGGELKAGFGLLGLNGSLTGNVGNTTGSTKSKTLQNAIESTFEEYAVDVIEDTMSYQLKRLNEHPADGTFIKDKSRKFSIIDLKKVISIFSNEDLQKLIIKNGGIDKDSINELISQLKGIRAFFDDTVLIKIDGAIILAEKSKFRISETQLQMINLSKKEINILGQVDETIVNVDNKIDIGSEFEIKDFSDFLPAIVINLMKALFGLDDGDKIINPISIYF